MYSDRIITKKPQIYPPYKKYFISKGTQTESEKMGKGIHENGNQRKAGSNTYIRQNRP